MYSELLHCDVHNKTNPTQAQEGRARRILIRTKIIIIPAPARNARGGSCHPPGCIDTGVSSSSSSLCPPSSLAFLLPIPTPRTVARDGSRGSSGDGRPHPRLPLVVVVVAQLGVLSWCQLVRALRRPVVHPASRGSQRRCGHRAPSYVSSAGGGCNVAGGSLPRGYPTSLGSLMPPM